MTIYIDDFIYRKNPAYYLGISGAANNMSTAQIERDFGVSPKHCPFCYNPFPILHHNGNSKKPTFNMVCGTCGCEGPLAGHPEKAIILWDNRDPLGQYDRRGT